MPNQTPIPTQINIAPSGMTWKNWKLVHGTDGFTTRETMEKYLCNPDRVRDLEECRDLNHRTIKQLDALIQLYEAQMEAVGAGGVEPLRKCNKLHQIAEPDAQHLQELAAYRFTVENLRARVAELEAQLAESTHPTQQGLEPVKLLAKDHANMRVDYSGLLGKVQREMKRSAPGYAEMIRQLQGHLQELGQRWYAGQTEVVDELLQLYCIESEARKAIAAQAKQGGAA